MKLKVLLFDCFNTLFDMSPVPFESLKAYANHVCHHPQRLFTFPEEFTRVRAWPRTTHAMEALQSLGIKCVAFSNGDKDLIDHIASESGFEFDDVIWPYWKFGYNKPSEYAYDMAFDYAMTSNKCVMSDMGMVTANPSFGDLHAAIRHGVVPIAIRNSLYPDALALAEAIEDAAL